MSTASVPLQVNEKDIDALDAVARSLAYTYLKEDRRIREQEEKRTGVTMLVLEYVIRRHNTVLE